MTDLSFDGRVVVVTGAGNGLGRSHALEFARRGAMVVVNDLGGSVHGHGGSETAAQRVVDEIRAANGEAVPNFDSVANPDGANSIIETAIRQYGRVDVVVNNAGILRDAAFHKMTAEQIEAVLGVHLHGAMHVTRAAWPYMRNQGYGRIVSTTSASGLFGNFGQTNYGAAKVGLVGLTRVLALEGGTKNIMVNAIAPVAETRMTEEIFANLDLSDANLSPEHITPVVIWLAHEDVPVSGEVFSCGGGHIARVFLGVTPGWTGVTSFTPETIGANLDAIMNTNGYAIPRDLEEELRLTVKSLTRSL